MRGGRSSATIALFLYIVSLGLAGKAVKFASVHFSIALAWVQTNGLTI